MSTECCESIHFYDYVQLNILQLYNFPKDSFNMLFIELKIACKLCCL